MSFGRRVVVTAGACVVVGGGAMLAAPVASAFTVTPAPGGGTITATQSEARAIHGANLGPLVDAVLPGFTGQRNGESLGAGVNRYSGLAAKTPGAKFVATVTGFPNRTKFVVGVRP